MHQDSSSIGFMTGASGIHALSAAISIAMNNISDAKQSIQYLFNIAEGFHLSAMFESEVLYGFAGYMLSILFIMKHLPEYIYDINKAKEILDRCFIILHNSSTNIVKFSFHDSKYIGAAHGLAGVLFTMLQIPLVKDSKYKDKLQISLDAMIRYGKDGKYCRKVDDPSKIFQWCHGSPGIISTLLKASEIYGDEKYQRLAEEAIEETWKNGILTKGNNLCHGISGNSYVFFQMYQNTRKQKYLYYAYQFYQSSISKRIQVHSYASKSKGINLMEGLLGHGCFCLNIIEDPKDAFFPGYDNDIVYP